MIGFVTSPELIALTSAIPKIKQRSEFVSELIEAFGLTEKMEIIDPISISGLQLAEFHTKEYIATLESYEAKGSSLLDSEVMRKHGLEYDCPPFPKMLQTICAIGGASIDGSEALGLGLYKVVINWFGGWHHGQPDKADGFCYLNDCVLAIKHLRHYFDRVMYIDLDLHHGNGVESAFYHTPNVLTYSLHKFEAGFYPGSGDVDSIGEGRGRGYSVNIPLKDGASDHTLKQVIDSTLLRVAQHFKPDAIVCQCGADGITGDPHQAFCYTPEGMSYVVKKVLELDKPSLILGGGGYNFTNVAKTWTMITADILGHPIKDLFIPEHRHFCKYGPGFEVSVKPGNMRDENDDSHLGMVIEMVNKHLDANS